MKKHSLWLIGKSVLFAIPIYFLIVWTAKTVGLDKPALSMVEAFQLAYDHALDWNSSARLLTITSVDLERASEYDGSSGLLPHWNIDFVASNNAAYHVSIRNGKIASAGEQGYAAFEEGFQMDLRSPIIDSPELAKLAGQNGLRPFLGKWARGLQFLFRMINGYPETSLRGATQDGRPALIAFNAQNGELLFQAERTVEEGGVYAFDLGDTVTSNFEKLMPEQNTVPENVSAIAITNQTTVPTIFLGTDARRDFIFGEQAQIYVSQDQGQTWAVVDTPFVVEAILDLKLSPDGARLFVTTTNGFYHAAVGNSSDEFSWQSSQQSLPSGHVTSLEISPYFTQDQTLWAAVGLTDHDDVSWAIPGSEGFYRSNDGGLSWEKLVNAPKNITDIAVSPGYPADPTLFVTSNDDGIYQGSEDGLKWVRLESNISGINQIGISPNYMNDHTLFLATGNGLWKSNTAGSTWELVTEELAYPTNMALFLALSPNFEKTPVVVYGAFRGGLLVSQDGGDSWKQFDVSALGGDNTPRAFGFLADGRLMLSIYPLLGWQPVVEWLDASGNPYSFPTPFPQNP